LKGTEILREQGKSVCKTKASMWTVDAEYYVGHCPLSEVYLMYMFWELAVLPSSGDWLSLYRHTCCYLFNRNVTVGLEYETFLGSLHAVACSFGSCPRLTCPPVSRVSPGN
jgi:hypothetical protein